MPTTRKRKARNTHDFNICETDWPILDDLFQIKTDRDHRAYRRKYPHVHLFGSSWPPWWAFADDVWRCQGQSPEPDTTIGYYRQELWTPAWEYLQQVHDVWQMNRTKP